VDFYFAIFSGLFVLKLSQETRVESIFLGEPFEKRFLSSLNHLGKLIILELTVIVQSKKPPLSSLNLLIFRRNLFQLFLRWFSRHYQSLQTIPFPNPLCFPINYFILFPDLSHIEQDFKIVRSWLNQLQNIVLVQILVCLTNHGLI
jgi:hypothetical protein